MSSQDAVTVEPGRSPQGLVDGILLGLVLAAFWPAALSLAEVWSTVDYYAHGYLVAPVAAAMAWSRRGGPAGGQDWRGLAILLVSLLGYAVGLLGDLLSLQGLALPVSLAGLALWRRGAPGLRRYSLPAAYLVFMVPVPPQWLAPVVTGLQSFVSESAVRFLQALAVPVLREGNVIVLPHGSLFVAEACSGITSIVTLLPVAALLAFLAPMGPVRSVALLASVVPVAMLWNLVRVLVTVVAVEAVGVERATGGALHESAGLITFGLGCVTLLALQLLVSRGPPAGAKKA